MVLSADKQWRLDLLPPEARQGERVSFADAMASHVRLAATLGAEHITRTNSGHNIYLYQPVLVVDAIRKVVDDVHQQRTTTTNYLKNRFQLPYLIL